MQKVQIAEIERDMKYLKAYDNYLKRLAESGTQTTGLGSVGFGSIIVAAAPFFAAIFIQSVIIAAFGSGGFATSALMDVITLTLAVGLFYSAFRVVYYKNQRNKNRE